MSRLGLILLLLLAASPARSALTQAELDQAGLTPPPGARLALDLPLVDETGAAVTPSLVLAGRPGILIFADYSCTTLCGTALTMAAGSLARTGLQPGRDYMLLVIGINPRDGPTQAAAMKAAVLGHDPVASVAPFLTGDPATLAAAQEALGYRAQWDAQNKQYAHPLGALVLAADGRVSRALGGLDLEPRALRAALVEASAGHIGTFGERLGLLCYGFDAARGVYAGLIKRLLTLGSAAMFLLLAAYLVLLVRRAASRA